MATGIGSLMATLGLDSADFRKGLKRSDEALGKWDKSLQKKSRSLKKFGNTLSGVGKGMTAAITLPVVGLGAAMLKSAADAEETRSKFSVVFGEMGNQAETAAKKLSDSFDLSSTMSRKLLGDTGDLLTGFGFTQKEALKLSEEVNALAVDLASFTNFSGGAEGASVALTKALLGESEQAKALGIVLRQDSAEYKDLVAHYQEAEGASLLQAKALTALNIATKQSKNAIGDYVRTSDSLSNQQRALTQDFHDMADELGAVMIPAAKELVAIVRGLVEKFQALSPETKKNIVVFAGIAAAVGPAVWALGSFITTIGGAVTMIPKMVTAMKALRLAMIGTPWGAIAAAIGLAVTALAAFKLEAIETRDEVGKLNEVGAEEVFARIERQEGLLTVQTKDLGEALAHAKTQLKGVQDKLNSSVGAVGSFNVALAGQEGVLLNVIDTLETELSTRPKVTEEIENQTAAVDGLTAAMKKAASVRVPEPTTKVTPKQAGPLSSNGPQTGGGVQPVTMDTGGFAGASQSFLDGFDSIAEKAGAVIGIIGELSGTMNELMSGFFDAKEARIDEVLQKEIAAIEATNLSEEDKIKRVGAAEKRAWKKKKELKRKEAIANKVTGIAAAIINTAVGVTAALSIAPPAGPILAGITAALGAVEVAMIMAQPIPAFATGGAVVGQTMAMVGEESNRFNPEVIMPMDKLMRMVEGGGNGKVRVYGELIGRGEDLIGVIRETERNKDLV